MYAIVNSVEERTKTLCDLSGKNRDGTHAENKGDGHKKRQNPGGNDGETYQTLWMESEQEKIIIKL